jgi:hypothetical protein
LLSVICSTCRKASWLWSRLGTVAICEHDLVKQGSEQSAKDFDAGIFGCVRRNHDLGTVARRRVARLLLDF